MATNGKAHMDILPRSEDYIQTWQNLSLMRTERTTTFDQLEPGQMFVLPGGLMAQTKLNFYQAQAATGQILIYAVWEQVVPV